MLLLLPEIDKGKYATFTQKLSKMADLFEFDKIESYIASQLNERENNHEK
jgi:hypothetical protein